MQFHKYFLIIAIFLFIDYTFAASFSDYIKRCKKDQKTINKCIEDNVKMIKPKLNGGIPELGIPAIEPFKLDKFDYEPKGTDLKIKATNIVMTGASKFDMKSVSADLKNKKGEYKIFVPEVRIKCDHTFEGTLAGRFVSGSGKFDTTISDFNTHGKLETKVEGSNNKQTIKLTKLDNNVNIETFDAKITTGKPLLDVAITTFINADKKACFEIAKPYVEGIMNEYTLKKINEILTGHTLDEFFE